MLWNKRQIEKHIKENVKDYGSMIVVSGLYKKLYGEFPRIGISGMQAECANTIVKSLPDSLR